MLRWGLIVSALFLAALPANVSRESSRREVRLAIRGVEQALFFYEPATRRPGGPTVLVLSGDGGWHGFINEIAEHLASRGYPTVGLDVKEYLASLSKPNALDPAQATSDLARIARFAMSATGEKPVVLVGWSEGAGLAVLAALDPGLRADLQGVVAVGLPELNELAWRTADDVIYITKKVPNEPTFNSKDYVGKLSPIPLAIIQSTHDDFVPLATAREIFGRAQDPKQFVLIDARNHRFEGQREAFWQALDGAFDWFASPAAKPAR